jgi:hypothetical protein
MSRVRAASSDRRHAPGPKKRTILRGSPLLSLSPSDPTTNERQVGRLYLARPVTDMEIKSFRYLAAKLFSRTTVVGFRPTLIRRPIVFCPSTPVIQMKLRSADGITGEDPSGPCVHCGWNLRRRTSVSLRSYNKPRIKYSVPDPPAHTGMGWSHHPHIQEGSSLTGQRDPANKWYSVTID